MGCIAGVVEGHDLVNGLEAAFVFEGPDDFFVGCDLEELWLLAEMAMAEVFSEEGVAIWQAMAAGHEAKGVAGEVVFIEVPHDFAAGINFHCLVSVATGDEEIFVGELHDVMRVARHGGFTQHFAFGVEFDNFALAFEADEVVAVGCLACAAELVVQLDGVLGDEFDLFGDLA